MTTGVAEATTSHEVTYLEAISQALDEEMSRDERVFLMGEDIGAYGGAFKITEGFLQKYGDRRVLDTPLAESGMVGAAIGAAMMGLRPVVEMQFADFISCAFDQIIEVAAKNHYRWNAPVPLVIRAPFGGRLVLSFAWPQIGRAFHALRCQGTSQGRDSRSQPGDLFRAQISLSPDQGGLADRGLHCADRESRGETNR
jgi:hypothetical protein